MKRFLLWPLAASCFLGAAYAYHIDTSKVAQKPVLPEALKPLAPGSAVPKDCASYSYSKPEALDDELIEMSGIVPSQIYDDLFYHVRDSGNDPFLIMTDSKGKIRGRVPFSQSSADPEELSAGPCPWGQESCVFVADTGDNFGWRSTVQIHAIEEKTLFESKLRSETLSFAYEGGGMVDVEAIAVERKSGDIYLFSKQKKKARVFKLAKTAWSEAKGKAPLATLVAEMPVAQVTGASMSADGLRLLLLNWKGVFEFSDRMSGPWFSKSRFIKVPDMGQQEAITYLPDQQSFVYSSERKKKKSTWGLVRADCQSK